MDISAAAVDVWNFVGPILEVVGGSAVIARLLPPQYAAIFQLVYKVVNAVGMNHGWAKNEISEPHQRPPKSSKRRFGPRR